MGKSSADTEANLSVGQRGGPIGSCYKDVVQQRNIIQDMGQHQQDINDLLTSRLTKGDLCVLEATGQGDQEA